MPGNTRQTFSHRSSLIAAGTRIEGTVVFAGTLHLRGEITGDVRCANDAGTLVVDSGGTITGSVDAPHIVVRGRLLGPMQAAQTIEIQSGGSSVGGATYRSLAIDAGGTVDGLLTPLDAASNVKPQTTSRPAPPPALDPAPSPRPPPRKKPSGPASRGTRNLALAITAVLIVAATLYWTKRDGPPRQSALAALPDLVTESANGSPPAAVAAPDTAAAGTVAAEQAATATKEAPSGKSEPPPAKPAPPKEATTARTTPVAAPPAAKKPAEPAERPEPDLDTVFAVKGQNLEKSATTIYVITREPVVIYKKMPDAAGKGTRLAFSRGRNTGIRITPEELLRVAQGEDLDLYYQGGKVWANPIENGTWMRFEAIEPPPPKPTPPTPAPAVAAPTAAAAPASASAPAQPSTDKPAAAAKAAGD